MITDDFKAAMRKVSGELDDIELLNRILGYANMTDRNDTSEYAYGFLYQEMVRRINVRRQNALAMRVGLNVANSELERILKP